MKMFKRISALILTLIMAFTLFACDSKETDDNDEKSSKSISTNSPEGALKAYFKAFETTDTDTYIDLMPELKQAIYNLDENNSIEEEVEEDLKNTLDYYEDEYGKNVKFSLNNIESEEMSGKKLKTIQEAYANDSDLNDIEIEEGAEVDFELSIEGDDGSDKGDGTAYVIKENGKWKVYNLDLDI